MARETERGSVGEREKETLWSKTEAKESKLLYHVHVGLDTKAT